MITIKVKHKNSPKITLSLPLLDLKNLSPPLPKKKKNYKILKIPPNILKLN